LAIYDAVAALCPKAPLAIKWPNDIFWLNKKVCGILLETMPKSVQHILIGFGINVNIDCGRFPEELRNSATSLFIETGRAFDIAELLGDICNRFQTNRSIDPSMAHATYCKRLYKVGSAIRIQGREGIFKGVLEDGRLCIADDGKEEYLLSGSIEFIHNPA
jgi:BirA family biotin operon repressor/biotin-[acetyl-CoA-carboxylase] ligase